MKRSAWVLKFSFRIGLLSFCVAFLPTVDAASPDFYWFPSGKQVEVLRPVPTLIYSRKCGLAIYKSACQALSAWESVRKLRASEVLHDDPSNLRWTRLCETVKGRAINAMSSDYTAERGFCIFSDDSAIALESLYLNLRAAKPIFSNLDELKTLREKAN